ncbi:hypothetical protein Bca4012_016848 [Brassica carinata]|uniref:GPI mannosyltransferase 1 n=1 Tax=Brassica carinata TaxID=52824 RepID=A0A8X7WQP5_BRACI|nr:hypothetical protein Bca52824_004740 [Brassica carinata]
MCSLAFLFFFNFSIYFYHIYLHYERKFSAVEKLIAFLPQFTVQFALVLCFYQDLVFCFFLQTVAFVAFNKVIKYFVWFYCLLPLILLWRRMKLKWEGFVMHRPVDWSSDTLALVGDTGYMLEFKGFNVFLQSGLVDEEGMQPDHGIAINLKHYGIWFGLVAGQLRSAHNFYQKHAYPQVRPDAIYLGGALLGACRVVSPWGR